MGRSGAVSIKRTNSLANPKKLSFPNKFAKEIASLIVEGY